MVYDPCLKLPHQDISDLEMYHSEIISYKTQRYAHFLTIKMSSA